MLAMFRSAHQPNASSILAAKSSTPKFGFITMNVPKSLASVASLKISRSLTRARHFGQRKVTHRIRQTFSASPLVWWLITSPLYGPRPQYPKRRRRPVAIRRQSGDSPVNKGNCRARAKSKLFMLSLKNIHLACCGQHATANLAINWRPRSPFLTRWWRNH